MFAGFPCGNCSKGANLPRLVNFAKMDYKRSDKVRPVHQLVFYFSGRPQPSSPKTYRDPSESTVDSDVKRGETKAYRCRHCVDVANCKRRRHVPASNYRADGGHAPNEMVWLSPDRFAIDWEQRWSVKRRQVPPPTANIRQLPPDPQ